MADEHPATTDVLSDVRKRFDVAWQHEQQNREEAREDLQFRAGIGHWPESVKQDRTDKDRPSLTINLTPQFVRQVTGDIRQNQPSIRVRPVDSGSDPDVAEVFTGLIRHIEQASDAQVAYITAADASATCGIGNFRILTEFADDETFEQDIRIRRIRNPFAVYWDPDADEITKSDARWCFVSERLTKEAFLARYPDASMVDFEGNTESEDWISDWWNGETVRIAEYWVKEPTGKKTISLPLDDGMERTREVETHRVVRYVVNGAEVLEGPEEWAGKYIPVIPVVGEEVHVGERVVRHGIVRFLKDPQRLFNYWRTAGAEAVALAPKAPWTVTPAMIEGHKDKWDNANRGNPAYLPFNADPEAPTLRPERTDPAYPQNAMFQEAQQASQDMNGVTGIYPPSLGEQSNETSGRAILARQREGDTGTFVYIDNLSRALRHAGVILVDLIPKIYETDRVVRILGEDDTEDFVRLNVPVLNEETGETVFATVLADPKTGAPIYKPALDAGKYDVQVTTGPSYSTKRIEAADSMMQFAQAVPQAAAVIADLVAKNMDWPGAEQIAERLKKMLPPGMAEDEEELTPEEEEARAAEEEEAQQQQQLQMAGIMAELEKLQAQAEKDRASAGKMDAESDAARMETTQRAMELALQNGGLDEMIALIVRDQVTAILAGQPGNGVGL